MPRSHVIRFALLLLLATAGPARAQVDERAISFGIGGGPCSPVGDARTAYRTGFNGTAFMQLDLGRHPLAVRADFIYDALPLRSAVIPPAGLPGGGTGTLIGGVGDVKLYLRRGSVRPYVLGGAGGWSVRTEYDASGLPTTAETRFVGRAGAGVQMAFGTLLLYAEGTYDRLRAQAGGTPIEQAIEVIPVTVGVLF